MATLGLKEMGKFLQTQGSHSKVHWENAKKGIVKSRLDAMPFFLQDDLLSKVFKLSRSIRTLFHLNFVKPYLTIA